MMMMMMLMMVIEEVVEQPPLSMGIALLLSSTRASASTLTSCRSAWAIALSTMRNEVEMEKKEEEEGTVTPRSALPSLQ